MRNISSLITIALLSAIIFTIKILDNPYVAFSIMITFAIAGFILSRIKSKPTLMNGGFGILYGSLFMIILTGGLLVWLGYNFPK